MLRLLFISGVRKRVLNTPRNYCRCIKPALTHVYESGPINSSLYPSGLILVHEERDCPNACISLTFDAGSRYELPNENGITHFFEHLCFKGTKKRSKSNIETEMNEIGGKFKCYTTREMIGFSAECLSDNIPRALELLTDCIFNNSLSNNEIEIQKCIIYQEMLHLDTDTSSVLFDYIHSAAFQGTPLSQSVMGPSHNLYNINSRSIAMYIEKMFVPARMIFSCVGPIKHEQACNLANTYLNRNVANPNITRRYRFTAGDIRYRDDSMHVAHIALTVEAPPFPHADYLPMLLAAMAIGAWDRSQPGGPNHSCILAQAGGEGIFNSYESFYIAYRDAGLWGLQFVSPRMEVECALALMQDEWMKLCTIITDSVLIKTKQQLKWKILKENETVESACHSHAKWVFYTNFAPTIKEKFDSIDKLVADDVRRVCYEYIYGKCPVVTAIGATEALLPNSRLTGGMYWLRF
ncbi:mitochondrial-processing peptidase subunit beta-like [Pieris brassicae]|uniref:mitochondrial-processing peptidase subunit beta-like n=1 Tax=Pieris brassicae TaxID=7116 RepID=UPI001E65FA87|nr:mitochondrial-processing peptidase subunit beta-like [Pieris brassicae]